MEEKRYGVKLSLITALQKFQMSLKHKRVKMPFLEFAEVYFNGAYAGRLQIMSVDRHVSLMPSIVQNLKLPRQEIPLLLGNSVTIKIQRGLEATINFDLPDHGMQFITSLGNLAASDDSGSDSDPSPPKEN